MANTKQAEKRVRQSAKRRLNNKWQWTRVRTAVKNVRHQIELKDHTQAMAAFKIATSLLDRMQIKGKMHINTTSRLKSRLNSAIKALVVPAATASV